MIRKLLISQLPRYFSQQKSIFNNDLHLSKIPDPFALELSHINKAVKSVPALSLTPINLWETSYSVFRDHGVKAHKFIEIVVTNPMFLSIPSHKLTKSFELWRSCQFGERNCIDLLTTYPYLLFLSDEKELMEQIAYLRQYVKTTKNCYLLIRNAPNVISDNCKILDKKFEYLIDIMKINISEIVKSEALSKTLIFIKTRHKFLDRLGLFKIRSSKLDSIKQPTNNPRLYQITDTDDQTFAENICHVTLTEYDVFKEMYAKELKKLDDEIIENEIES